MFQLEGAAGDRIRERRRAKVIGARIAQRLADVIERDPPEDFLRIIELADERLRATQQPS